MIRYIGLIVAICIGMFSTQIVAQTRSLRVSPSQAYNMLHQRLNSINNADSVIEYYTIYAMQVFRFQPDSIPTTINKIDGLTSLSNEKRKAHINLIKSNLYSTPEPDSALIFSKTAFSLFKELGEKNKLSGILNTQARIYNRLNDYLAAEDALLKAVELVEKQQNSSNPNELGYLLDGLASTYMRVGATDIARQRYLQRLELGGTKEDECRARLNISNTFKVENEIESAKAYLEPCFNYEISNSLKAVVYESYGDLEKQLGNIDKRIFYTQKSIDFGKSGQAQRIIPYYFLAEAYYDKKKYVKSDSVLRLIDERQLRREPPFSKINLNILQAKLLIEKDENEAALEVLNSSDKILQRLPETPLHIEVNLLKADILKKLGDLEAAYELAIVTQDTRELVEKRTKLQEESRSKVRFQMRAKNRQLQNITTELGTVKTRNAIITFVLILIALYVIYRYRVYYLLKEERTRNIIARDLHDDLSATLSSISFFSEAAKREGGASKSNSKFLNRIDESALEAKEKINDIIWAIDPENDDWDTFITKCKRYAAEMFESKNISYNIDIDNELKLSFDIQARKDLWLIFKEIITNLVRHSEANNAEVVFEVNKDVLTIFVVDDGIGFDSNTNSKGNGISNIHRRMNIISKKSKVHLTSTPNEGTKWELVFIF